MTSPPSPVRVGYVPAWQAATLGAAFGSLSEHGWDSLVSVVWLGDAVERFGRFLGEGAWAA